VTVAVQVLLSVRNGARFLPDQMDSLAAQADVDVDVLARDDHSQDDSPAILRSYAGRLPLALEADRTAVGLPATYLRLLAHADRDRDAWAFCDQDDIWEPDKLATAVAALTAPEVADRPALWVCASAAFDEHGPRPRPTRDRRPDLGNALVEAIGPGCCMVWNRALMDRLVVPPEDTPVLHDTWLYASATLLGTVLLEPRPLVRYRLHERNAIGVDTRMRSRLRRHRRARGTGGPTWESLAATLRWAYGPLLTQEQHAVVAAMADGNRRARLRAWRRGAVRRSSPSDNLQLLARLVWFSERSSASTLPPV
jgi:glycosyltransferase involved in cell wall biosynthesis